MTYIQAEQLVIKSYGKGNKGGFEVCAAILEKLSNPHNALRVIHVTGTNGKGSTCAFLQQILRESGYKTGMFTSPHLCRFNERFNIDGEDISDTDFASTVGAVAEAFAAVYGNELFSEGNRASISYYELLTIMAFKYFHDRDVDIAIIEVGVGGRADATNILEKPLLSVLTKVSLDHTDRLGSTVETITAEKCGIVKHSVPLAVFSQGAEVLEVARGICFIRNSPVFYPHNHEIRVKSESLDGIVFSTRFTSDGKEVCAEDVRLKLIGSYQAYNAANVVNIITALNACGLRISDENMRRGFLNARWPGRMEIISNEPLVIVDGAHNPEGALAVRAFMENYLRGREIVLVAGILNDKDYEAIIRPLAQFASRVVLTQPKYAAKAYEPDLLMSAMSEQDNKEAEVIPDCFSAIERAIEIAEEYPGTGVVFVSGSLYLVGDAKMYMEKRN